MRGRIDKTAFPSNTNCSQRVVASDHTTGEVSCSERLYSWCCSGLELVLKYYQP